MAEFGTGDGLCTRNLLPARVNKYASSVALEIEILKALRGNTPRAARLAPEYRVRVLFLGFE